MTINNFIENFLAENNVKPELAAIFREVFKQRVWVLQIYYCMECDGQCHSAFQSIHTTLESVEEAVKEYVKNKIAELYGSTFRYYGAEQRIVDKHCPKNLIFPLDTKAWDKDGNELKDE